MAALAVPPTDVATTAGTYPIRLGASIVKPSSAADNRHYTSVRYNHKPQLRTSSNVTATIKAVKSGEPQLRFKDGGSSYGYKGQDGQIADEGQYVLVLKGEGKDREAVLERLSGAHAFNLVSAPTGTATELARLHPHIGQDNEVDAVDEILVAGEEASDEEADESNPFDYRHFLKAALAETAKARKPAAAAAANTQTRVRSTAPVYVPPAKRNSLSGSSARQQPVEKRKLPVEKLSASSNNKRSKSNLAAASTSTAKTTTDASAPSSKTKKPTTDPNLPRIHLDRKASLRKSSYPLASHSAEADDDDGELVLENEMPTTSGRQQQSAMSRALTGHFLGTGAGKGPISLHSAATSPAGSLRGVAGDEEEDSRGESVGEELDDDNGGAVNSFDFEFRDDDDEDDEADARAGENDADHEDDDDADVEDLELPSPVRESRPSISAATVSAGVEEDDLDAQLAAAMAEEAEEEESEEE